MCIEDRKKVLGTFHTLTFGSQISTNLYAEKQLVLMERLVTSRMTYAPFKIWVSLHLLCRLSSTKHICIVQCRYLFNLDTFFLLATLRPSEMSEVK